jgi:hypothetical protein
MHHSESDRGNCNDLSLPRPTPCPSRDGAAADAGEDRKRPRTREDGSGREVASRRASRVDPRAAHAKPDHLTRRHRERASLYG